MAMVDGSGADIGEQAIVGFADDGIEGAGFRVIWLLQDPGDQGIGGAKGREGAGEEDGGFNFAQFLELSGADEFAIAVADRESCAEVIGRGEGGWQDGGDAGVKGG